MTWFGTLLLIYYAANFAASIYYAGQGGVELEPSGLLFSALIVYPLIVLGVVFIGTGAF